MTHQTRGHSTNQKRYISMFIRPIAPKISQVADSRWGGLAQKFTWHFNPVIMWQFKNVIFSPPQDLWPPIFAGLVLRLNGHHAQSQMTLLFWGHVTKTLYLHFHTAHGPWHWLRMREHHLSIYNSRDTSTTWQIENVMPIFFSTK